ncbi:MAG: 3-hydroxyisobutyrate dehydrogenase-like beta-hydroxyacid dehydrogenase [Gammaproteobacteria bacterium]
MLKVAVFGLGEAGSLISADIADAGVQVTGFDPANVETPVGVIRVSDPNEAVVDADVVMNITASTDAITAINQALNSITTGSLYADLSTSSATLKKQLASIAVSKNIEFVDIALMTIVLGNGLRTPALASGPGADKYVSIFTPMGVIVEAISDIPGDAATRKLLRSVMMKGLASLVIEAMQAGNAAGCEEWLWNNLTEQLVKSNETVLTRLVKGTEIHAERRLHEMEASKALLIELGVDPVMTRATIESLKVVLDKGVPNIPVALD